MKHQNNKVGVYLIQSIPKDEYQTGKKLLDDCLETQKLATPDLFTIFKDVNNRSEFLNAIEILINRLQENEYIPILHIETHGSNKDDGIILLDHSIVYWNEFLPKLITINKLLDGKLGLILSMCYGNSLLCEIDISQKAPFDFLLASTKEIDPITLQEGFTTFYQELFSNSTLTQAVTRMNSSIEESKAKFTLLTAKGCLDLFTNPNYYNDSFKKMVNMRAVVQKSKEDKYSNMDIENVKKIEEQAMRIFLNFIKRNQLFLYKNKKE